ncbi:MAG: AAA family ATPase [Anaerolineae bacterium]|nr:AAA family ATPase [Anaerolineae bacterium]
MRFSQVILENWRNFDQVDVRLQDRAFLVGPNASGKSNFLDVFRFLRDLVVPGGGFEQAVMSRGGVSSIRNLAARRYPDIVVEVCLQAEGTECGWRYRIAFAQDNQSRPVLKEERVWQGEDLILSRPDHDDAEDPERLRQTHLEQTFANRDFRPIADFFEKVSYFHLVPQVVRSPDRWRGDIVDPYGGDFLERIARTNARTRDARLRRITAALQVAVPQLRELRLEKDKRGVPHLFGNYEHWRPHGAWQTEADFSDGTLRLLGLLWSLLEGGGPLLLEEPELSLHPAVVRHIPQMMWRVLRDRKNARQVIVSTHSAELLSEGVAADEMLLFIPKREGSQVKVGVDITEIKELLEAGVSPGDVAISYTQPEKATQLALW